MEPYLLTQDGEEKNPDILASGDKGWLILEMTTQPSSKKTKLESYLKIDPRYLGNYGLNSHESTPDVITSRLSFVDDGPFCQIIVKDSLEIRKEEHLSSSVLKEALQKSGGENLTKLPEIPVTLLPEMKGMEIRRGLIDIVLQIFEPNCDGKNLIRMVDEGLERLADKIGPQDRRRLMNKVKNEMDILIKDFLPEYLKYDEEKGVYKATEKFKQHHRRRMTVVSKLKDWASIGPQKTINDTRFFG